VERRSPSGLVKGAHVACTAVDCRAASEQRCREAAQAHVCRKVQRGEAVGVLGVDAGGARVVPCSWLVSRQTLVRWRRSCTALEIVRGDGGVGGGGAAGGCGAAGMRGARRCEGGEGGEGTGLEAFACEVEERGLAAYPAVVATRALVSTLLRFRLLLPAQRLARTAAAVAVAQVRAQTGQQRTKRPSGDPVVGGAQLRSCLDERNRRRRRRGR